MGNQPGTVRQGPHIGGALTWACVAVVAVVVLTGIAFVTGTTFIGDDHLFLAFARYATNPVMAFVRDQHGGEFYRPLPMLLWWVLARVSGGSRWPFVALSFALHVVGSIEVGVLVLALRQAPRRAVHVRAAAIAAGLFFLAPVTQEAAFWYSASTDLLATVFGIAAVIAVLRERPRTAALFFAGACWSKESALIVPVLAAVVLFAQGQRRSSAGLARRIGPLVPVAAIYAFARTTVLHGLGQAGDPPAPLWGKVVQIVSGLSRIVTGDVVSHVALAWTMGGAIWAVLLAGGGMRLRRSSDLNPSAPVAAVIWVAVAVTPLLAAPWVVGARYFYLPAVGVAWLAAELLAGKPVAAIVGVLAALLGLDLAQDLGRHADIHSYEARVSSARRAVADGLKRGYTTFHIAAGIKDLDLAIKEDSRFTDHENDLVVLDDVPASFIAVPEPRAPELDFLLAQPPLPPTGAYRFGNRRIVGLARRGDDPTLEEVIARMPAIRFIRLRMAPSGQIIARDTTDRSDD